MKSSTFTYYLLTIFCFMGVSCADVEPKEDKREVGEPIGVQLTLDFPISARKDTGVDNDQSYERYIQDIRIFAFVNGMFVEEATSVFIYGTDGDETRTVHAVLQSTYRAWEPLTVIALTNAKERGITKTFSTGTTKSNFYSQLDFVYGDSKNWSFKTAKQFIPMWGEWQLTTTTEGGTYHGTISLKRAIAKVGISVAAQGEGLSDLQINEIQLRAHNTHGYCAPKDGDIEATTPYIPGSSNQVGVIAFSNLKIKAGDAFEDMIYIPEQKNMGVNEQERVYLYINVTIGGTTKWYSIEFKNDNGAYYDVLRNYSYMFNIKSAKLDEDANARFTYELVKWENINIKVPAFD